MATAQLEKVKEFLTCTVCADAYSDPCTLMCQHSFCRICITKYTKTKPEALRTKTIPCPSCRQLTKVPDSTKPVEEWAAQIKPSIIILGLIDTSQPDPSTAGSRRHCSACEQLRETTPATSWCQECKMALCDRCTKLHQTSPASQDHEVCDLSGEVKVRSTCMAMCIEHKNNFEFYCKDCKKSVCPTCCVLYHKGCKSVDTIESMMPEMKSKLQKKKEIIADRLERYSTNLEKNKASMNEASKKKFTIKSQIESVSKGAINKIRQNEQELMDHLDQVTTSQMSQLQADAKSEEIEVQKYRQHCEFIDQALNSESVMDMFTAFQACESGVLDPVGDRDTVSEDRQQIADISFTQDTSKVQRVLDDLQLGRIDVIYQNVCSSVTTSAQPNYGRISLKTPEDKRNPCISDIATLVINNEEVIIITDENNKCVKSFYTRKDQRCCSRLPLDDSPEGMSKLNENHVVVSVSSSQIITVKVSPNLKVMETMETDTSYNSLVVLNADSLAAASNCYWISGCVDILDMRGKVVKSITIHRKEDLYQGPFFMCVNSKGNILVTDKGKGAVICLTPDGRVLWKYAPSGKRQLRTPSGITTDGKGNIFLADEDAGKVIQLTEKGKFVKEILIDGISKPNSLTYHKPGKLLICDEDSIKELTLT